VRWARDADADTRVVDLDDRAIVVRRVVVVVTDARRDREGADALARGGMSDGRAMAPIHLSAERFEWRTSSGMV
jgi:hypothetical protein